MSLIIGRAAEVKILHDRIDSKEAEFIAIYGRRRIGKTFLVKNVVSSYKCTFLEVSGIKDGSLSEQLTNFVDAMAKSFHTSLISQKPKNWKDAFNLLTQEINRLPQDQTVVIFLDELPWLATRKSKLIQHIDYFWNNIWSSLSNFKLIVCGSAASWMLEKLIRAKGGLYNRITKSILLKPFTLYETEKFLLSRNIKLNHMQILELYMVMGGVPHYLKNIETGKSATQNIDQICFTNEGILYEEFTNLFASLFDKSHMHEKMVGAIAGKHYGISRKELLKIMNMKSGGDFEKITKELEASGFIKKFIPYKKLSKDQYFKVIDEYTMFYQQWIAPIKNNSIAIKRNYWHTQHKNPSWQAWSGYAFECVCYKHINQIISKLGLENIGCVIGSWRFMIKDKEQRGAQIDLLFDRDDNIITVCEIKYNSNEYVLNKQYALETLERNNIFAKAIRTQKQIFTCFITNQKLKPNVWSEEMVDANITSDDLFA